MPLFIVFTIGALAYPALEILWRGYTHWSMALTGGVCLTAIYLMNLTLNAPIVIKCIIGAVIITAAELAVGSLVNLRLGLNVWDYSDIPLNFKGQICILFSFLWFLLCIPVIWFCELLRKIF